MLYVGIDQHKRHLTVCARDEQGEAVIRRQVRTDWPSVDRFLISLWEKAADQGGYVAVVEVCGFNGWLVRSLQEAGCTRTFVVAAPPPQRNKTDKRDAAKLSELLWVNRERIAAGNRLVQLREVYQTTETEEEARRVVRLRLNITRTQTRVKNHIGGILRRHNMERDCPTKGLFTQKSIAWLKKAKLPEIDRVELDMYLERYELNQRQLDQANKLVHQHANQQAPTIALLCTMPKIGEYTALALWAHIGPIERFPHARSLAHYFGLTPGCRNSGETDRPGSITKAGHPIARFLLGQAVLHALRGDPGLAAWYRQVRRRRGAKIARVAVMRRLCEALWHMLSKQEPYEPKGKRKTKGCKKTANAA